MRQLWTFRVSGGTPFHLQVQGNPVMRHDGGVESLLKALCTNEQAMEVMVKIRSYGCTVDGNSPQETEEQKTKRRNILHVLGGEQTFPCLHCPHCAWFDPTISSLCGAGFSSLGDCEGWEPEAIEGAMSNEKYASDYTSCPIRI